MKIQLEFTIEQLNVLLRMLDSGPHASVRQIIDYIIAETTRQQQSAQPAQEAAE